MLNDRLEIVEDEFVTSIDHYDKFYVNLLFDRSIYLFIDQSAPIWVVMVKYCRYRPNFSQKFGFSSTIHNFVC